MKQIVEIEIEVPEGYVFDRYDFPENHEDFIGQAEGAGVLSYSGSFRPSPRVKRLIIKRVATWVTPTQADIDAADEPIPCRVRDNSLKLWNHNRALMGITKFGIQRFVTTAGICWQFCEIQK